MAISAAGSGKTDMERIGLFQEMTYITIGDAFRTTVFSFNESAGKNRQMLPGGSKLRCAKQDGYFAEKFDRVFDGEAYADPIGMRRRQRMEAKKKNLGKAFLPASSLKTASGLGGYYGTISGPIPAFSPLKKEAKPVLFTGKNVMTNPGKLGTGYGYIGVTLDKYPENQSDPFGSAQLGSRKALENHHKKMKGGPFKLNSYPQPYFNSNPYHMEGSMPAMRKVKLVAPKVLKAFKPSSPGKKDGGCKQGTFDPYPEHSNDPYPKKPKDVLNVVNKTGKTFIPNAGPKSRPVNSLVNQHIMRTLNTMNYRSYTVP